ncbi:hypothetical protein [Sphingobacterium multivorum]|uniref:Uncharacterized protein n=1 Tax=Sphingobacterium multivorum TaxID=28454 RepID=A0A654D4B0_SPHMU|nr:hypothetical protein [Sphingobacterium multivorum]VXC99371.1 hypothetical protein SPHINGO8BC_51454 [Sphingobacterium multivorum]
MKSRLIILLLFVVSIASLTTNAFLSHKIDDVQNQVYLRDSLISVKTDREIKSKEETNELLKSLGLLFENSKLTEDGKFDVESFIKMHLGLKDSIRNLNNRLDLIRNNYGIYTATRVKSKDEKQTINETIIKGGEKVDSALLLLPRFRDRLVKIDKNTWTIDRAGKELKSVTEQYNKDIDDYNDLNKKYNELAIKYNADVKKYRDILRKIADKGLIKIDTLSDGYEYHF